jgi:hypothetical protein
LLKISDANLKDTQRMPDLEVAVAVAVAVDKRGYLAIVPLFNGKGGCRIKKGRI